MIDDLTFILLSMFLFARSSRAQQTDHYEAILIDTSGSIGKGGMKNELFREYLVSIRKLLLTEPPNSRVWVTAISSDSFGGAHEVLKGWTPDARDVFSDDLNRAWHQLAASFETKAAQMSPVSGGTDIFGALWRAKAVFESNFASAPQATSKNIWIFSDMMNETRAFSMPDLLATGPEQMLERAKANGLLVPLNGYTVYVVGASPSGLTPKSWLVMKGFWTAYFSAAGAELVTYSAEPDAMRQ